MKDKRAVIRRFVEYAGDLRPADYSRDHVSGFKRALQSFPKNATRLYPQLGFKDIVARNAVDGHAVLSVPSINNKLSTLSAFGRWIEENLSGVSGQSFATSTLRRPKARASRKPFSDEHVAAIFNSYTFMGCQSEQNQGSPGSVRIRDYRFWVPLIAAFTGARLNEITQLTTADVREQDGIWCLVITGDGDGQSTKTKGSKRLVPIHRELVNLGLLDLHREVALAGKSALFHEIPVDRTTNRRSKQAGQQFRRHLDRLGIKGGAEGGLHRFRHTVADKLRAAGVPDHEIAPILGHAGHGPRVTARYGELQSMTLRQREQIVSKIAYPGVDVASLK